jgi:membrane protease subunit HflK
MTPSDDHPHPIQRESQRAALGGDVASQALNEALRVSFRLLKLAMVLVAALFFLSGIFTVKQGEQAFILRFGDTVTHRDPQTGEDTPILGPGIHFAWPFLVDEVVRFPTQRTLSVPVDEFWFVEEKDPARPPTTLAPGRGGYALTGDVNILHSKWVVYYRVTDPVLFFEHLDVPSVLVENTVIDRHEALLKALVRNVVIRTMAHFSVDEVLFTRRKELQQEVFAAASTEVQKLGVGMQLARIDLESIVPPRHAKQAFDAVAQAEQERSALIHRAEAYYSETINQAKGQASREIGQALAYKTRVAYQAAADAKYIRDLLNEYPNQPQMLSLFLQQRLLEALQEVLEASDERFVVADPETGRRQVRIETNRDPKRIRQLLKERAEKEKIRKLMER